mgnify:CR=1 FL=1
MFEMITHLCSEVSRELEDATLSFEISGENKSWEDLRHGSFKFIPARWSKRMGDTPTFGCYAYTDLSSALFDLKRGKISRWVHNVSNAVNAYLHVQKDPGWNPERLTRIVPMVASAGILDAAMHCSVFCQAHFDLTLEALESGNFFSFKLEPGSKYSEDIQGMYLARSGIGSYQKWWTTEPSVVLFEAGQRTDVISHARLSQDAPAESPCEDRAATDLLLKTAWGF